MDQTIQKCLCKIYMKIEFSSQQREGLLVWSTNMAVVKSRENDLERKGLRGPFFFLPAVPVFLLHRRWWWKIPAARVYPAGSAPPFFQKHLILLHAWRNHKRSDHFCTQQGKWKSLLVTGLSVYLRVHFGMYSQLACEILVQYLFLNLVLKHFFLKYLLAFRSC